MSTTPAVLLDRYYTTVDDLVDLIADTERALTWAQEFVYNAQDDDFLDAQIDAALLLLSRPATSWIQDGVHYMHEVTR